MILEYAEFDLRTFQKEYVIHNMVFSSLVNEW